MKLCWAVNTHRPRRVGVEVAGELAAKVNTLEKQPNMHCYKNLHEKHKASASTTSSKVFSQVTLLYVVRSEDCLV